MKTGLRVARPLFPDKEKLLKDISSILDSGRLMNGEFTSEFEKKFAVYSKSRHAISVNSGTTALEVVLRYIGVSGHEVIVPTNTFIATPNAVIFAGGKPILADIKEGTYSLDPAEVRKRLSKKTKAVIVVHIAGLISPEIEEIASICKEAGVALVEDCAHTSGASYNRKMAGTFGLAGCFSFYPTKVITTGTGGMIVTSDDKLDVYARSVRLHGAGSGLSEIVNIGNDWFMDEISSAMGLNQLSHLGQFIQRRTEIAGIYDGLLEGAGALKKFTVSSSARHAYYKYPVQIADDIDVVALKRVFGEKYGFELESIYWPTCHMQPVYKKMFDHAKGDFPIAEYILSRQVTLPMHADMTAEDARYAFRCLIQGIGEGIKKQ